MNSRQNTAIDHSLLPEEQHNKYIEKAGHHIDQIGGIHRGFDLEKWLAAEAKIEQQLAKK